MNIVTSIKPFQLIALEITHNISTPELLIKSNASPHDYALKPSELKKLKGADLVIWFGPGLEPFLEKIVANSGQSLTLSQSDITFRHYDEGSDHNHDGHNHGSFDPHIWLGPEQAAQTAAVIASRLSELDPPNAQGYQANLSKFLSQLDRSVESISARFEPYQDKGYYVFHDAYGYFESYFDLNKLGHFTLAPERKPGAKTLIHIRSSLKRGEASCVFSEPQFKPAIVSSVTRGSDVNIGVLDPLATEISIVKGAYFNFLNGLADSYIECLSK
jgi:zinc transport system substrate-binding protein